MVTETTGSYLSRLTAHRELLERTPFEHQRRGIGFDRLLRRLSADRDALLAVEHGDRKPLPAFHLLTFEPVDPLTDICWSLQCHPRAHRMPLEPGPPPDRARIAAIASDDWLLMAGRGDLHHPALAAALGLRGASDPQALAWSWNTSRSAPDSGPLGVPAGEFVRIPGLAPETLLAGDYVGRALALRAGWLAAAPDAVLDAWLAGDCGPAVLALATEAPARWRHHPEFLGIGSASAWRPWSREEIADQRLHRLANRIAPVRWRQCEGTVTGRPHLEPDVAWNGVSVVIPFRDHVDATLNAVAALAKQRLDTWVEAVLVDNETAPDERARLDRGLQSLAGSLRWRFVDYPYGFSHSRQCNLGVAASQGEVIIILNNDAYLQSVDCIDQLARWACLPGVGTVGTRIVDDHGALVCAGIRARLRVGMDFDSPVEESRDPFLAQGLRQVTGNTGACFAMRRDRFLEAGGFDAIEFPIGFNDVEFCARTAAAGMRHLNLGWIAVRHRPGASRGKADEVMQKALLRERHPEIAAAAQFQFALDEPMRLAPSTARSTTTASVAARGATGPLKKMIKRILNG